MKTTFKRNCTLHYPLGYCVSILVIYEPLLCSPAHPDRALNPSGRYYLGIIDSQSLPVAVELTL
jgi:hypothetical protein